MTIQKRHVLQILAGGAVLGLCLFRPLPGQFSRVLITDPIDEGRLVTLAGNTRAEARVAENDRGIVPDSTPVLHMLLQLRRPAAIEAEFVRHIEEMHDKSSPYFRQWMTAQQMGEQYGLAQQDLDTIKSWLESKGFTVNYIYPNRVLMDVSGTAGIIRNALHTEIHYLEVKGEAHWANMRDPQIPGALAPAIIGFASIHDFRPRSMARMGQPNLTGNGTYTLVPADFQVIYNIDPLLRRGINGAGQSVAVLEESDPYSTNDISNYRSTLLKKWPTPALVVSHPNTAGNSCTDPGINGYDEEASLDPEMVSATAPMATVIVASCSDYSTVGALVALENLVSNGNPPPVVSYSFGYCEAGAGSALNATFYSAFQSAAAAGVSVFVAAGDEGPASCDNDDSAAMYGVSISSAASTPYNVAVGGTDFEDLYNATKGSPPAPQSTYWSSANTATYGSAKSYIPEIPWNNSCAGYLLYNYNGSGAAYGSSGFCNTGPGYYQTATGGSGGPSGCATGTPSSGSPNIVSGTCAGYAKPSWQSGILGNPADGVRDIPDVSLYASNGTWGHGIVFCWSDRGYGGAGCSGSPANWNAGGGTSFSAPLMAGIQALVNQKWNIRAGNPNPTYYLIAKAQFGANGNSACYSINQPGRRGLGTACASNDVTQGDNVVNCVSGSVGCYAPSGADGALSSQRLLPLPFLQAAPVMRPRLLVVWAPPPI